MSLAGAGLVGLWISPLAFAQGPLDSVALGLALVPVAALGLALSRPHPSVFSHAVLPASVLPLALHRPDLFRPPIHAGPGALVSIVVSALLLASMLRATTPPSGSEPRSASLRASLSRALAALATLAPALALWLPLFATAPRAPAIAFATVATLTLARIACEAFPDLAGERTAADTRAAETAVHGALRARAARIPLGVALGLVTGVAGLAWLLRTGGIP